MSPPHTSAADDGSKTPPKSDSDAKSRPFSGTLDNTVAYEGTPITGESTAVSSRNQAKSNKEESPDIPTTLGRFKINGILGSGGFGTVYLGFDDRLKRNVAIKVPNQVLSGVGLDKFLEEAQRLAQLRHP
jgi:hypothetical protein